MLPKHLKLDLRSEKDFFSSSKRKHSQYFSFFYRKNDNLGLKITVVVPKKTVKLATQRNEVKRKIYSVINKIFETSENSSKIIEKNINLVIVVNKKSLEEKINKLVEIIESSLIEITV